MRKAVDSALAQRGDFRLRIVVVDDASPIPAREELGDLLSQQPDRFILVEQKNAGCYPASNTALDHVPAGTDCVAFLDSDDVWTADHVGNAVWALDQGYDLYFSDFYQLNQTVTAFNRAKRIDVARHPRIHSSQPIHEFRADMFDQILRGNILGTSTIVYDWHKFSTLRYLEDFRHTGAEYILWLNLAMRCQKIAFSSAPETTYGGGVNIYSEAAWGSEKYLSVRHDEIKYKQHILAHLPVSAGQAEFLRGMIRQSRANFARGYWHGLLRGKLSGRMLSRQVRLDPATLGALLVAPARIALNRGNHRASS